MSTLSRLEQAVADLEAKYPTRKLTIREREEHEARILWDRAKHELSQENARHQYAVMRINRDLENITVLRKMLNGSKGYVRCSQGQLGAESGFTTIGEVIPKIGKHFIDLSLDPLQAYFGMEVWEVDERGMMNIIDRMVDSSD